jgi:hypothetical protein
MSLIRFPKKRYILQTIRTSSGVSESSPSGSWVAQGNWNGSSNLFPVVGKLGDSVKEGYTWDNVLATTTLLGPDGGIIPAEATIRAKIDDPGQTLSNWKIYYN